MTSLSDALGPWLFGPRAGRSPGDLGNPPDAVQSGGLLDRLLSWYPDGPVGPNQHLTAIGAAVNLAPPSGAYSALLSVSGAGVFLSLDGTAASAVNGLALPVGTLIRLTGIESLHGASVIQQAAGAVVDVVYFT